MDGHEKLRYEVNHFLSRAGQNSWESMLQQVDSDEVIVGVTPVTDRMNRPARPRDRKEYEVGQVRWTYIVETSSDPGLINNGGDQAIRTSEGLMLGKWRPTVVVRVDKQYCVVAELGRRRRQYLDGLSLSDLLGRCGVALDLNYSHDYDTLSEDHLLFRSVAKPLEIGGYEDDDFQLSGWSVVQPGRLHTLGFDDHSLPCGWLKAESTEQLLAMQAQMSKLRAIVESRYDRKFLRAPLPSRLTPEQRTALSHIKDVYRRLLSPPAQTTSTSSGQTSNQQDDLEEFEALVEGNRRAIEAVNAPPLVASEPVESKFSIPDNGRGVSPSSIIQKAKSVSHANWKSAAAAVCQKEDMLYQAKEEYETVEADRWSTTGERRNLKRKRDDVEMELEIAQVREMSYKKLHRDVRSFQASQYRGQDKEIKLCNTLTSAFSRAQLETRRAKNRLDQRRRTPLP
ncbi:uncharacterized protein J4E88_006945 [Alternaria novae-zelandiae]|uniref:uncharacterized protein n=1 Tax=Alternaria novae-zelandiae TaxID=430562 RepID=UPI0020C3C63C|nr:uncharacterized protein J4E88_006945 [Alternaria novae-zelandiae]KAI4677138.1 hypothetical protein J4E88_006945 [Alternaria novae-zelandiae]